jgi:hypothetical protein
MLKKLLGRHWPAEEPHVIDLEATLKAMDERFAATAAEMERINREWDSGPSYAEQQVERLARLRGTDADMPTSESGRCIEIERRKARIAWDGVERRKEVA